MRLSMMSWRKEFVSPDVSSGETTTTGRLLFLAGGGFGGDGGVFFLVGAAGRGVFLAGFLLVGFRGFIAHNFYLSFAG